MAFKKIFIFQHINLYNIMWERELTCHSIMWRSKDNPRELASPIYHVDLRYLVGGKHIHPPSHLTY